LGYLIENGVITDKPVKDVIIHGHIAKFGSKIKAIGSSDTVETSTGYCGKNKQWVPVEDGGPAILVEDAPVGDVKPDWFWQESFNEYRRQMLEVACGKRKKSEVYLKFVEDATEGEAKKHSSVCMLNKQLSVDDEVKMLRGSETDISDYVLGVDGKLEAK
jgi:uncharacterized protein YbaR (Trm112 family)